MIAWILAAAVIAVTSLAAVGVLVARWVLWDLRREIGEARTDLADALARLRDTRKAARIARRQLRQETAYRVRETAAVGRIWEYAQSLGGTPEELSLLANTDHVIAFIEEIEFSQETP